MDWNRPKNAGFPDIYPIQKLVREKTGEEDFVVKANPFQFFFFGLQHVEQESLDRFLSWRPAFLTILSGFFNQQQKR